MIERALGPCEAAVPLVLDFGPLTLLLDFFRFEQSFLVFLFRFSPFLGFVLIPLVVVIIVLVVAVSLVIAAAIAQPLAVAALDVVVAFRLLIVVVLAA